MYLIGLPADKAFPKFAMRICTQVFFLQSVWQKPGYFALEILACALFTSKFPDLP